MIDKKGKLFGKISIIDIITIALIIIIIALVLKKMNLFTPVEKSSLDNIELKFYQAEVNDFTPKAVKIGDKAKDSLSNVIIGEIKDVKVDKAVSFDRYIYGSSKPSSRDGYVSTILTINTKGIFGPNGININGTNFYIGQTINLKVGNSIFYGEISGANKL